MLVDIREYEACLPVSPPPPWPFENLGSGVSTVAFQHWNFHGNKSRILGSITEFRRITENRKVVLRWRRLMRERILLIKTTTLPSHFPLPSCSLLTAHTDTTHQRPNSTQHTAEHKAASSSTTAHAARSTQLIDLSVIWSGIYFFSQHPILHANPLCQEAAIIQHHRVKHHLTSWALASW